jgi:hypothetical protein
MLRHFKSGRLTFGVSVGLLGMALMSTGYARVDKAPTFKTDPYPFVENLGQLADPEGRPLTEAYFTFEAPGMRGYVTRWGLTLFFYRLERDKVERAGDRHLREVREPDSVKVAWERVDIELVGGCVEGGRIRKGMPSVWGQNYYLAHCPQGILGVRGYGEVVVERVWPGVDWVLRYDEGVGGVKQEFVVQGGYRWDQVRLRIWSRGGAEVSEGRLRVRTEYGEFVEEGLVGYYGSERVGVRYRLLSERQEGEVKVVEVGYAVSGVPEVGEKTLVIDPVLQWGTYFGGSSRDCAHSVAVDGSGNLFVVGDVWGSSFPLANPPGGGAYFDNTYNGGTFDAFIAKFSGSNLSLVWSTYFGGSSDDLAASVAVDGSGSVFVVGWTRATNFPRVNPDGGAYYSGSHKGGTYDAFIAKFSGSNLSLVWSTYFGGSGWDEAHSVAVDGSGNVFVVGFTGSTSLLFPLANPPGGGAYFDNTLDGSGDAFIAKFLGSNLSLVWSTYFGGSDNDWANSVAVDGSGNVFVVGSTSSGSGFPLANPPGGGAYFDNTLDGDGDAFIAKFSGSALRLVWSTYFGGNNNEDEANSVAVDGSGNVFVGGWTRSTSNFPRENPGGGAYYQGTHNGGFYDAFIAKFSGSNLRLVWSTYYGGSNRDFVLGNRSIVAGAGFIAVVAITYTTNASFPVANRSPSCPGGFYQGTHGGGVDDLAILTFDLNGRPVWRTFYGGPGDDGSASSSYGLQSVAVYSTYLYVMAHTNGGLPASHLPNPGGGAYYDNTYNGGDGDVVLLRFDYANCPLLRWEETADGGAGYGRGRWEAWWDGGAVRVAGIEAPGWYSVMGMDGRIVGRWYVDGEGGALEGPWSRGLYVVYREGSGESRRVYVGP